VFRQSKTLQKCFGNPKHFQKCFAKTLSVPPKHICVSALKIQNNLYSHSVVYLQVLSIHLLKQNTYPSLYLFKNGHTMRVMTLPAPPALHHAAVATSTATAAAAAAAAAVAAVATMTSIRFRPYLM
jgi:hypothetical protein